MRPSGIEPIVTVPNSLGMVAVFLFIICVGVFCLYVTKVVTDALFLLHCAVTAIPFVWLGSMVEWNAKVKNKELR
ncbi:hypothetical protein [Bacillus thuringiensis]|uniref:hypothetical protein n=1 Tax=Bacillus thuringiensis TaxID=1428 RepID=UPI0011A60F19|nr:hypothetical protein [Bacillus thuringiensis]